MATRGRRPSATIIQLAQGKINKDQIPSGEPMPTGPVEKLPEMTEAQAKFWNMHIAPLFWLTSADSYKAYMWCTLAVRFSRKKGVISSALIGQLRALGSELGMDPASRRRMGTVGNDKDKDGKEGKYFAGTGE